MIGPVDRSKWYWTPKKLNALVATLEELAKRDGNGDCYLGPDPLNRSVCDTNPTHFKGAIVQIANGVRILTHLGFLEAGRRGVKRSNYRRRFYPNALERKIRWADVEGYRRAYDRKRYPGRYTSK